MKNLILTFLVAGAGFCMPAFSNNKSLNINEDPLAFPVASKKANVGSFWGASREGGKRRHDGIDIFARKGTPVVAIADGVIGMVRTTPKGGKTVWLQKEGRAWSVYYAHLDKQLVTPGQFVKKGDVIGTVGNTGNARTTPSHLHFGIYTRRGAVDPLPYVKNLEKVNVPGLTKQPVNENIARVPSIKKDKVVDKKRGANTMATVSKKRTFPEQYIWKTLSLPSDPGSEYYITVRSNVVKVNDGKYKLIGKFNKNEDLKYPYRLALANQQLLINNAGKVYTSEGQEVGKVL